MSFTMSMPRSPLTAPDKKFLWARPKISKMASGKSHKVSFSGSSKSSNEQGPSDHSASSRSSSPSQATPSAALWSSRSQLQREPTQNWLHINRKTEALWQEDIPSPTAPLPRPFLIYHPSFLNLLGPTPTLKALLHDTRAAYFHEAGIYLSSIRTLFLTSNLLPDLSPLAASSAQKATVITKLTFHTPTDYTRDKVRTPDRSYLPNGGCYHPQTNTLIFCAQGSRSEPAALISMSPRVPHHTSTLINNYHGRPFNSPNDVVAAKDGALWFTDPIYGHEQGFRPPPQLPQQVYRFDPATGDIRVVADGFGRPNGICFAPDERTVYITDTDYIHGDGSTNPTRASTIYAFTVFRVAVSDDPTAAPAPFLTNRRVFAFADTGAPDGIKCDMEGNVYAGCGDGINVWNPGGSLMGKILVDGGVANFCFGEPGEMWAFGEERLWRVGLAERVKGAVTAG